MSHVNENAYDLAYEAFADKLGWTPNNNTMDAIRMCIEAYCDALSEDTPSKAQDHDADLCSLLESGFRLRGSYGPDFFKSVAEHAAAIIHSRFTLQPKGVWNDDTDGRNLDQRRMEVGASAQLTDEELGEKIIRLSLNFGSVGRTARKLLDTKATQ